MNESEQLEKLSKKSNWIKKVQEIKSPLTKNVDLEHLQIEELQSLKTLLEQFTPSFLRIKKIARLLFMFAGFLWFPIFFSEALGLSSETLALFRSNQARLYLILMSMWGFLKHRMIGQFSAFMHIALILQKPWYTVTIEELKSEKKLYVLEWFAKRKDSERKYFHIAFMWILLSAGFIQTGRQILLLIN